MSTVDAETASEEVAARGVHFSESMLYVELSDGREIGLPLALPWLGWLAKARPEQRAHWSLEPRGFAVYWDDLDNGIEVAHLLTTTVLTR